MGQPIKRFKICRLPSAEAYFWQTNSRVVAWTMFVVGTLACNWDTEIRLMDTTKNVQLATW